MDGSRSLCSRPFAVALVTALLAVVLAVPGGIASAADPSPAGASGKTCAKGKSCPGKGKGQGKGKKKGKGQKKGKGKAAPAKPDPGPYREGMTCSMSLQMEYAKHGFVCIDISTPGFPLTVLAPS